MGSTLKLYYHLFMKCFKVLNIWSHDKKNTTFFKVVHITNNNARL